MKNIIKRFLKNIKRPSKQELISQGIQESIQLIRDTLSSLNGCNKMEALSIIKQLKQLLQNKKI